MLLLGVIRLCVCAVIFGTIVGLSNTDRQRQGIIQSGHVEKGYVLPSGRKGALSRPDCSSNGSEQPVEWKDPKPTAFHGEMENLKQLYTSTNGDNWYYNENWNNSSLNFCTWYGVGCDEEGHVLSLSLNDNNLTGYVPRLSHDFPNLKYVCFFVNPSLTGSLDEFLRLSAARWQHQRQSNRSLERLSISFTAVAASLEFIAKKLRLETLRVVQLSTNLNITGNMTSEFCRMRDIRVFSVGETSIGGSIPDCFGDGMPHLRFVDFEYCHKLGGHFPTGLANLTSAKWIHLSGSNLRGRIPAGFGSKLNNLLALNLDSNHLFGEIPRTIGLASKLKFLRLDNNQFHGDIPTSELAKLKNLTIFTALRNSLTLSKNATPMANLRSLLNLDLSSNPLNVNILHFIRVFPSYGSLEVIRCFACGMHGRIDWQRANSIFAYRNAAVIDFGQNNLTGQLPLHFSTDPPYLSTLRLHYNNIEGGIPLTFARLPSLNLLDLRGNKRMFEYCAHQSVILKFSSYCKGVFGTHYSCPEVSLVTLKAALNESSGNLLVDPQFYGYRGCSCRSGFFGGRGICLRCPREASCKAHEQNKTLLYEKDWYPTIVNGTLLGFERCHRLSGKTLCNPYGNCTCFVIDGGSKPTVECDRNCVCNSEYNVTGRKCSLCVNNDRNGQNSKFYMEDHVCHPCGSGVLGSAWTQFGILLGIMILTAVVFVAISKLPACKRRAWSVKLGLKLILFAVLLVVTAVGAVEVWLFQLTVLFFILTNVSKENRNTGLMKQMLFFSQVMFALFRRVHIYVLEDFFGTISTFLQEPFSFHFDSLACQFPFLSSPIAQVGLTASIPVLAAVLAGLAILCRYIRYKIGQLHARHHRQIEASRFIPADCAPEESLDEFIADEERPIISPHVDQSASAYLDNDPMHSMQIFICKCAGILLFVIEIVYFPLFESAFKILIPCRKGLDGDAYMYLHPAIDCKSMEHFLYRMFAAIALVVFGLPLLIVVIAMLLYYEPQRARPIDGASVDAVRRRQRLDAIVGKLADPFRPPHSRYMSFMFMAQKIALAATLIFLEKPPQLIMLVVMIFSLLILHQVYFRPFKQHCPGSRRIDDDNLLYTLSLCVLLLTFTTSETIRITKIYDTYAGYFVFAVGFLVFLFYLLAAICRVTKYRCCCCHPPS